MNEKNTVRYRGLILHVDKDLYDKYWYLKGRRLSIADIDQYLINEADKKDLEPFNIDMNQVLPQFTVAQMEDHINQYLKFEIKLCGGTDFEYP